MDSVRTSRSGDNTVGTVKSYFIQSIGSQLV